MHKHISKASSFPLAMLSYQPTLHVHDMSSATNRLAYPLAMLSYQPTCYAQLPKPQPRKQTKVRREAPLPKPNPIKMHKHISKASSYPLAMLSYQPTLHMHDVSSATNRLAYPLAMLSYQPTCYAQLPQPNISLCISYSH